MYRIGFGDCFLITFPGPQHILVDCGVHSRGDIGTLDAVVANVADVTKRRLDAIVVSHAHEDHIGGFLRAEDVFRTFTIGSVWLPWTENPKDDLARELGRQRAAVYESLVQHFAVRPAAPEVEAVMVNAATSRNVRALDNLRAGFGTGADVQWFEKGDSIDRSAAGITGLSVRFLGPPRDPDFLRKMNPPKPERYLRVEAGGASSWENEVTPFRQLRDASSGGPVLTERQRRALHRAVEFSLESLALALDQALNNTSLVCLFSYRGRTLLFPGDAQYGNWSSWLRENGSHDVLRQVSFYKVAHHGSENATPKTALEGMSTGDFAAMLSTQSVPWPSIPYPKLMDAIDRQTARRVVRSDSLRLPRAPTGPSVGRLPKGFRKGEIWIDYYLPI